MLGVDINIVYIHCSGGFLVYFVAFGSGLVNPTTKHLLSQLIYIIKVEKK